MIRVAVVGLGAVTRNVHLPAYGRLKHRCTVVAGCDPDSRARQWASQQAGIPSVYETLPEMLGKARPDVVSVCTPPAFHREPTIAALGHGCHVYCEKPIAEDLAQADEMIRASQTANRLLIVNTQYPCMRIHEAAKRLLGSPDFGRLRYLHAHQFLLQMAEAGWRGVLRRRVTFDMGVHVLELIRFFFDDDPVRIHAHMPDPAQTGRDLLSLVSVEFADGRAASMLINRISPGGEHFLVLRLDGEFASIHTSIESETRLQTGLHLRRGHPRVTFDYFRGGRAVLEKGRRRKLIATEGLNPWVSGTARNFEQFIDGVEKVSQPRYSASHHRKTLALVLAAYDSAAAGRVIELAPYYRISAEN